MSGVDSRSRRRTVETVQVGQLEIEEHHVGPELARARDRLRTVRRLADDLDALAVEHATQTLAHHRVIVHHEDARKCRGHRRRESLGNERQRHADRRAAAVHALDAAGAAEQPRALPHPGEAEPAPLAGVVALARETDAVVAHLQMQPALAAAQLDRDVAAVPMACGVDEALLEDAEHRGLHRRRHPHVTQVVDEVGRPARLPRRLLEGPPHGLREAHRVDGGRPQRPQHAARLLDRGLEPLGRPRQLPCRALSVAPREVPRGVDMLLGADDELGDAVVHLERDAPPLLFLRHHDLLDHPREGLLLTRALPPGAHGRPRHARHEQHLDRVHAEREGRGHVRPLEGDELDEFPPRHADECRREGELPVSRDGAPQRLPGHPSSRAQSRK